MAIDIFAITNLNYIHNQFRIFDRVQDSITSLSDAIPPKTRQFLRTSWSRIIR